MAENGRELSRALCLGAVLLVSLTLLAACGELRFNRETGQFLVPLGGEGDGVGSNR